MTAERGLAETRFEERSSKFETNPNDENSNHPDLLKITDRRRLALASGNRTLWGGRSSIHLVVVLLALALSACAGQSAPSKFYVLSPLPQSAPEAGQGVTIGVLPVAMPDYLDRPQIVTRLSSNEIRLDEFNRWAEPLKENFYTVLVENLSTLLNSERIIKTSQNLNIPETLLIGVEVVQFDGALGGDVVLVAKWGLIEEQGRKILLAKRSSLKEPTSAQTYEALVAAESRAVAALSREIAAGVLKSLAKSP